MVKHQLRKVKRYLISIYKYIKGSISPEIKILSKKTKISKWEIAKLRASFPNKEFSTLYNNKIEIGDSFWHLHSLNEIFVGQTYKFKSTSELPIILDCGANIGLSAIFFKQLYPNAKVIAFEPDKNIYRKLTANLKSFKFHDIEIHNKAVWVENTILNFDQDNALGGKINQSGGENKNTTKVEAIALSDFITQKIEFLKIDIEGAEFDVIKSIEDKLHMIQHLFIEYHSDPSQQQKLPELLSAIQKAGFRLYIKEAWDNMPIPFEHFKYKPFWDLQLNIFAYRI